MEVSGGRGLGSIYRATDCVISQPLAARCPHVKHRHTAITQSRAAPLTAKPGSDIIMYILSPLSSALFWFLMVQIRFISVMYNWKSLVDYRAHGLSY